jgi:hypothetical protein
VPTRTASASCRRTPYDGSHWTSNTQTADYPNMSEARLKKESSLLVAMEQTFRALFRGCPRMLPEPTIADHLNNSPACRILLGHVEKGPIFGYRDCAAADSCLAAVTAGFFSSGVWTESDGLKRRSSYIAKACKACIAPVISLVESTGRLFR